MDPEEACFMCEAKIDVKFIPCEHAVMCSTCAQRAKRCPTCRVSGTVIKDSSYDLSYQCV